MRRFPPPWTVEAALEASCKKPDDNSGRAKRDETKMHAGGDRPFTIGERDFGFGRAEGNRIFLF